MTGTVERWVREWVIRGRDPRDPEASSNGVKTRTMLVTLVPPVAVLATGTALDLPTYPLVVAVAALGATLIRSVCGVINDVSEEWDDREVSA